MWRSWMRTATASERFAAEHALKAKLFSSVRELADADVCRATFVVTPTEKHREHATLLIRAGHRVLLEKAAHRELLDGDREFAAELDRDYPSRLDARFSAALRCGVRPCP